MTEMITNAIYGLGSLVFCFLAAISFLISDYPSPDSKLTQEVETQVFLKCRQPEKDPQIIASCASTR